MMRVFRFLLACLLTCVVSSTAIGRSDDAVSEYALRAVVLYKIAKFVEWPEDAFADASSPLVVCVVGTELTLREFKRLEKEKHGARPLHVRRMQGDSTDLHRCHVAYLQEVRMSDLMYTLRKLHGSPVLAVGESKEFLDAGGSVVLTSQSGRISFAVNQAAAKANQLRVSSQLMLIAERMSAPKSGP